MILAFFLCLWHMRTREGIDVFVLEKLRHCAKLAVPFALEAQTARDVVPSCISTALKVT